MNNNLITALYDNHYKFQKKNNQSRIPRRHINYTSNNNKTQYKLQKFLFHVIILAEKQL